MHYLYKELVLEQIHCIITSKPSPKEKIGQKEIGPLLVGGERWIIYLTKWQN